MKREKLYDLRKEFQKMLKEYKGKERIKLDNATLELLLFDYNNIKGSKYKYFLSFKNIEKLDLSNLSFDNVDVCRIDFTNLNVNINPQTVFQKNLSYIKANSVTFTGPFDGTFICNADFTGSKNAVINPQTISAKNLSFVNLRDAKVEGKFDNTFIRGTSFEGCNGPVVINPQTIMNKDLGYTNLNGVIFTGSFDNCIIEHADFKNTIGVSINPGKIYERNLKKCNFDGVTFTGPLQECVIACSDFSKANNVEIDLSTCVGSSSANLENATILKHKDEYEQKIYELKKAFKIG